MKASVRPRTLLLVAVATGFALLPMQVAAEDPGDPNDQGTVQVGPLNKGPVVSQGSAGYDPNGITAAAATKPSGSGTTSTEPTYTYSPVPYNSIPGQVTQNNNDVISTPAPSGIPISACPAGQTGYYVYDSNGNSLGIVCVPNPTDSLLPPTTPEIALADQASSRQPWPALVMGINPGTGLTGLPSWFWLRGSAAMPDATASSGPLTVSVRARLAGVTWEFGDGIGYDSIDLGQAYPTQSDVQHVYQTDTYRLSNGYTAAAVLRYLVTYSVTGGPWLTLGVKTKPYSQPYSVYQVQPEAIGAPSWPPPNRDACASSLVRRSADGVLPRCSA